MRFRDNPFRVGLVVLALAGAALPGAARAQNIVCPEVGFATDVGDRMITLRWDDPPDSVRSRLTISLMKVRNITCGPDSICTAEDSLSWRATSLPAVGGLYTGGCDRVYVFRNFNDVRAFSTVDPARVAGVWSGTSFPRSAGTFQSCRDSVEFRFEVTAGGEVGGPGGGQVAWQDTLGHAGTVVVPAGYTPGTPLDVFAGLRVSFTSGTLVAGDRFTIRTRVPKPVLMQWVRPVTEFEDTTGLVTICRPDTAVAIEDGLTISLSPGDLPEYEPNGDSVAVFRVRAESYDGFRVYRSDIRGLDEFVLVREFNTCRLADSSFFEGTERVYRDTEVHNGFPYRYAVTCYDTLSASESAFLPTPPLYPRTPPAASADEIRVVPNPYKRRAAWEEGGEGKVQFVNVPRSATIRIYTSSGSLVREIGPDEVNKGCSTASLPGCVNWDLRNGQGREVVSGIYIFQAEAPGTEPYIGKFMVAR